eukprot:g15579.t1
MQRYNSALFALLLLSVASASTVQVVVDTRANPIFETFSEYLSINLDWWTGANGKLGWKNCGLLSLELNNPLLRKLTKELGGAYLRIGGSLDVALKYLYAKEVENWCKTPAIFRGEKWNLCLTLSRWDEINIFARESNLKLVFGISYPGLAGEYDNKLFDSKTVPPLPRLLGPCIGMNSAVGNEECADDAPCVASPFVKKFLNETIRHGQSPLIDGYCIHSYNNDGGDEWKRPGFLSQTLRQVLALKEEIRKHSEAIPIWAGEVGPHNEGGLLNVTDRYMSSLWFADALGKLASVGVSEFGRQALVGAYYGLLDVTNKKSGLGLIKHRDYTAFNYPTKVLNVTTRYEDESDKDLFHVYAHCSALDGKVGIIFINIDKTKRFRLDLSNKYDHHKEVDLYHFTASNLYSNVIQLNGIPLKVNGDQLPPMPPVKLALDKQKKVDVAPLSFGFLVYDCRGNVGCVCE